MSTLDPAYGLGLERDGFRLVQYNPLWPQAFTEEAARLRRVMGPAAIAIEHYGSTAVPGLRAKPIIDIQVGVKSIDVADELIEPLSQLGYEHITDNKVPEHRVFGRSNLRTHLLHIVVYGGDQWTRSIRFRDRLRSDPVMRASYEALKDHLVDSVNTRDDYTAGKSAFVNHHSI